jgi:methionyl-tRNA formyltransferase
MTVGAGMVLKTVDAIIDGSVNAISQNELIVDEADLHAAPKIFKETCRIDWQETPEKIHNLVRGLSPYPAAWTELEVSEGNWVNLKIYKTEIIDANHNLSAGSILSDGKSYMDVAVKGGYIRILELQTAGKKRMTVKDFINGIILPEHPCVK